MGKMRCKSCGREFIAYFGGFRCQRCRGFTGHKTRKRGRVLTREKVLKMFGMVVVGVIGLMGVVYGTNEDYFMRLERSRELVRGEVQRAHEERMATLRVRELGLLKELGSPRVVVSSFSNSYSNSGSEGNVKVNVKGDRYYDSD